MPIDPISAKTFQDLLGDESAATGIRVANRSVHALLRTRAYEEIALRGVRQSTRDRYLNTLSRRQRILRESGKTLAFLIAEASLHYTGGDPQAAHDQMHWLLELDAMPNVRIGVIPLSRLPQLRVPLDYQIHDEREVVRHLVHAEAGRRTKTLTGPGDVDRHLHHFAELLEHSIFGIDLHNLVTAAAAEHGRNAHPC